MMPTTGIPAPLAPFAPPTALAFCMRRAVIKLVNIHLCLVGGIAAVFIASLDTVASVLHGGYVQPILSVSSIVGFVTVAGFTIRSGFILLNRYRVLEQSGMSATDAIKTGSEERLIPIIMTSLTTILGLLPLVWLAISPAASIWPPSPSTSSEASSPQPFSTSSSPQPQPLR